MAKTIRVKAHTDKNGKRVKAHTRTVKGASGKAGAGSEFTSRHLLDKHQVKRYEQQLRENTTSLANARAGVGSFDNAGYHKRLIQEAKSKLAKHAEAGRGGVIHKSASSNKDKKPRMKNGSGKSVRHTVDSNTTSKGTPKKHSAGRGGVKHNCATSNNDKSQRMAPSKSKRSQKVAKYTKYMNSLSKMRKK